VKFFYSMKLMWVLFLMVMPQQQAQGQPVLAPKQLIIVKPGIDKLHGTWLAAVINREANAQALRVPILLPRETEDFKPTEGVEPGDLKIESDGVYIEKKFQPGVNVISLAFIAPAEAGLAELNFDARLDLGELTVMTPRGMMKVQGEKLVSSGTDVQDLQTFDLWVTPTSVVKGDQLKVTITGVPQGRQRLWVLGLSFALVLVIAAISLTYWSQGRERAQPQTTT
jgi:hypothetical protein